MEQNLPLSFIEMLFKKLVPPDLFQAHFLKALLNFQDVERGSIWIKKKDVYLCLEASGVEAEKVKGFTISAKEKSVVGSVITSGKMTIAQPGKDKGHYKGIEEVLDLKNTLILCFPLRLKDGKVYGAVEILDTSSGGRRMNLDSGYLKLLESLVTIGGIALNTSLDLADQHDHNVKMKKMLEEIHSTPPIIGQSEVFLGMMKTAEVYATNDFPVMIMGESGTGKELLAKEIHRLSSRRGKPFLAQNCSAIPDTLLESEFFGYKKGAFTGATQDKVGLFEAADGGTVFLDEIADMPLGLQAKILRVLQSQEVKPLGTAKSRKVDFRIISATNRNLNDFIKNGGFREDLYYRLNVLPLNLPPLRMRKTDTPLLLTHFLERYSLQSKQPSKVIAPEAMEKLIDYPWPGNIREMENLVKYLLTVTHKDTISLSDLPPPYNLDRENEEVFSSIPAAEESGMAIQGEDYINFNEYSWAKLERAYVLSLLERTKWNIAAAASQAGVKRTTFSSRMKKLGISKS